MPDPLDDWAARELLRLTGRPDPRTVEAKPPRRVERRSGTDRRTPAKDAR